MKIIRLIILLLMMQFAVRAQSGDECTVKNTAFSIGEQVYYKVSYNWNSLWLNAGEVSFKVNEGFFNNVPCYHMIGTGSTYKSYDMFYRV